MAENLLLPTLSPEGWVSATAEQADYLISHFFTSEYSQTHIYKGYVASLPWIIREGQGNMNATVDLLRTTLSVYFSHYFHAVNVECNHTEDQEGSSKITLNLYVSFKDANEKEYVLARVLEILDSKISKIIKINNTGQV